MHEFAATRHKAPLGVAFPLRELVYVRGWAERRGLAMDVVLDQVRDGAEFEELLVIRPLVRRPAIRPAQPPAQGAALTLWRAENAIIAQARGGQPKAFSGVRLALAQFEGMFAIPAPPRFAPLRRLTRRLFRL